MRSAALLGSEGEALARFVREAMRETDVAPRAAATPGRDTQTRHAPGMVQLVRVGGIAAAVPLSEIAVTSRYAGALPESITHDGRRLRVVTPERVLGGVGHAGGGYLLVAAGADLALPCDVLEGRRLLANDDVRRRRNTTTRPWVSGVINDEPRCLLHLPALTAALAEPGGTEPASTLSGLVQRQNSDTHSPTESM